MSYCLVPNDLWTSIGPRTGVACACSVVWLNRFNNKHLLFLIHVKLLGCWSFYQARNNISVLIIRYCAFRSAMLCQNLPGETRWQRLLTLCSATWSSESGTTCMWCCAWAQWGSPSGSLTHWFLQRSLSNSTSCLTVGSHCDLYWRLPHSWKISSAYTRITCSMSTYCSIVVHVTRVRQTFYTYQKHNSLMFTCKDTKRECSTIKHLRWHVWRLKTQNINQLFIQHIFRQDLF